MKYLFASKFFVVLIFSYFFFIVVARGQDSPLISNGDFESGKQSPWISGRSKASITNSTVHRGKYAIEIESGELPVYQVINIKPNSRYKLSGYLKTASGAETVEFGIQVARAEKKTVASALTAWTYKELAFVTGATDSQIKVLLYHAKSSNDNSAWADDLSLDYLGPYVPEKISGIHPLSPRIAKTYLGIRQQPDQKMKWFQDAKFGLFIHWGLYSGPAQGEWLMHNKLIAPNEYKKLATPESGDQQFIADQYNPELWTKIAKKAGIKYMNLTTMHHDGFALFDSKYPNAFTAGQTLGRDLVKDYADACHKAGIRVGFYKTLINWRYPGYYDIYGTGNGPFYNDANVWGYKGDPAHKENARIMKEELYAQVKELMSNYGKIDHIFWDGGWLAEKSSDQDSYFFWESGKYRDPKNNWPIDKKYGEFDPVTGKPLGLVGMIRKLQPDIIMNPRSGWYGDFQTEEGGNPVTGPVRTKEIWEKCMTMHSGWGYNPSAEDTGAVIKVDDVKRMLADCVVRNMNLLINVGPDRHGNITKAESNVLVGAGDWIRKVSEAVYNTRGGPWNPVDGQYGYCYNGKVIYVYLFKDFKEDKFTLPAVDQRNCVRVYDPLTKMNLKFVQNKAHQISITGFPNSSNSSVRILAVQLDRNVF